MDIYKETGEHGEGQRDPLTQMAYGDYSLPPRSSRCALCKSLRVERELGPEADSELIQIPDRNSEYSLTDYC